MNIGQIVAEITATTTGLRKAQQDAGKQFAQIQNEANATSAVVKTAFAVAGTAAVLGFVTALAKATDGANETRKAMLGLESTAKAFGQNFEDANKSVKDLYSDGLMPIDKSIRGFKNLLSVGFDVSQAMQISKAMKDIGAFNNVVGDLGQAYEDSTKGLKTGSMELIENIGLTQRLSTVMKDAGVDISNGIDLTNNAAQRRAVYNAILAEGAKFEGNAAKLANDNAAASAKMSAAIKNLSDEIGNRANPYFSSFLGIITEVANATSEWVKGTNLEKVTQQVEEQETAFYGLSYAYLDLKSKAKLTADETKRYNDIILELQKKYGEYLKNVDLEKDGYNKVKDAIDGATIALQKNIAVKLARAELEDLTEKQVKDQQKLKGYIENTTKAFNENLSTAKKIGKIRIATELVNGAPKFFEVTSEQAYKIYSDLADKIKDTSGKISATEKNEAIKRKNILEQSLLDNANIEKNGSLFLNSIRNAKNNSDTLKNLYSSTIKSREDFQNKYKEVLNKYDVTPTDFEGKQGKSTDTSVSGTDKEKFRANMEKTLAQKKAELEYKMQADLVNANKEEENIIKLKYASQDKILEIEDTFAKEVAGAKTQKQVEVAYDKMIKAIGEEELALKTSVTIEEGKANAVAIWEEIQKEITGYGPIKIETEMNPKITIDMANEFLNKLKGANAAVGLTDVSNYGVPKPEEVVDNSKETEQAFKDLDTALKNMVDVIDNDVINALYSLGEGGKSFINSFKGFQAGQSQGGLLGGLGMLTGGIGMFSSAVSIFQTVGGLFSKSTYNFEEAVKKMVEKIGDMTPEEQLAQVKKARAIAQTAKSLGLSELSSEQRFTEEEAKKLKAAGAEIAGGWGGFFLLQRTTLELLSAAKEVIPNLSEALGTSAEDFRQDISSVLGDSSNYSNMEDALYNSVFSSVKQGLINASLLNEPINLLTKRLRNTVTEAVSDGILTAEEKAQIQEITGEINVSLKPFIEGMQAVGLDLIGASDSLADATDNFSSTMNRNLKMAERISKDSLGNGQIINIDLTGANLGGMSEANTVNSLNKAVAMSNITKVGVR